MPAKSSIMMMPVVSKLYCSLSDVVLMVRRRPNVANGGGLTVLDDSNQRVVFKVDSCGVIGKKGELILRDWEGNEVLLIRKKGSIVEALSFTSQWKGFSYDYLGTPRPVFTMRDSTSCFLSNGPITICVEPNETCGHDTFMVKGDFPGRNCSIVNSKGDIGVEQRMANRDAYDVLVNAGIDQAFVFGVISVLDYIYDGSTRY